MARRTEAIALPSMIRQLVKTGIGSALIAGLLFLLFCLLSVASTFELLSFITPNGSTNKNTILYTRQNIKDKIQNTHTKQMIKQVTN